MKHFYSDSLPWKSLLKQKGDYQEGKTGKHYFVATCQKPDLTLQYMSVYIKPWSFTARPVSLRTVTHFPCRGERQAGKTTPTGPDLPIPRLVLLVFRVLALVCVDEPVLTVVLVVFLAPEAPSLCLAVAAAPPVCLDEAGRVALCCFLAWASRGRTWFPRARGLVSHLSEQIRGSRKKKKKCSVYRLKRRDQKWGKKNKKSSSMQTDAQTDMQTKTQEILEERGGAGPSWWWSKSLAQLFH